MTRRVIKNAAKCNKCGAFVESKHRHDFKTCKCGNVSVDGGLVYIRRVVIDLEKYRDMCEYEDEAVKPKSTHPG